MNSNIVKAAILATSIAIPAEGLRLNSYLDQVGILTVCYGHTGADVVKGKNYSLAECRQHLNDDMMNALSIVDRCHPNLPVKVLAAFGDATFNIGPKVACKSTASKYLDAGNLVAACNELPKWNKARVGGVLTELAGLTKRREIERKLCLDGASDGIVESVQLPEPKPLTLWERITGWFEDFLDWVAI